MKSPRVVVKVRGVFPEGQCPFPDLVHLFIPLIIQQIFFECPPSQHCLACWECRNMQDRNP